MARMNFVKLKTSNAGEKKPVARFLEWKKTFLADIVAIVSITEIPPSLVVNWDQTIINLVAAGQWRMNLSGQKVVPL